MLSPPSLPPWLSPPVLSPPEPVPLPPVPVPLLPVTTKLFILVLFPAESVAITSTSYLVVVFRSVHVYVPVSFVASFLLLVPVSVIIYLNVTFPLYLEFPR